MKGTHAIAPTAENMHEVNKLQTVYDPTKPITEEEFKKYTQVAWTLLCNKVTGNYQIVTTELVDFVRHLLKELNVKNPIEICAGYGILSRELGFPGIDRRLMLREAKNFYTASGQALIDYPEDMEDMTAFQAIKLYQPDAVVGCWVTQKYKKKRDTDASQYGVDEEDLLSKVPVYIHVGNESIHGHKRVRRAAKYIIKSDWICSRSVYPEDNEILIFCPQDTQIDWDNFPDHLDFDIIA